MAVQNTSDQQTKLANRVVKEVFPVSRLVREARQLLEGSFPLLWVEGEISNLAMPASGHIYFTLKDEAAQVRCAMFRNRNSQLRFTPENGMQVLLRVRVTLYEGRGEFQLVVEHMEEAGSGALQRAYEALKQRLGQEGLFSEEHKKLLPKSPATVGIISSPDGAALHDILSVLKRRFPAVNVILYPVAVQGETAASQLKQAVELADKRNECDVLIIGRGGGSLEDLWSFNDEQLARAIFHCQLPIISAVGHEIDFTIADFVADVRAPTPSVAAEIAVPDAALLARQIQSLLQQLSTRMGQRLRHEQRHLQYLKQRLPKPDSQVRQQRHYVLQLQRLLNASWQQQWRNHQQKLDYLAVKLTHPQARIDQQQTKVAELSRRLEQAFRLQHQQSALMLTNLRQRLKRQLPTQRLQQQQQLLQRLNKSLSQHMQQQLTKARQRLAQPVRTLAAVSPLNTLERGYSITQKSGSEAVIRQAKQVKAGEHIQVRLHQGQLHCTVTEVIDDD